MTTQLEQRTPREITKDGLLALQELKALVTKRPDNEKLVIKGKQYLFYSDWQILGMYFGITTMVKETWPITTEIPSQEVEGVTWQEITGYKARAVAIRNGIEISAAEAICIREEDNWKTKPRFQLLSMAQTRACAKALRNCLQWVVRLPTSKFAEETAEEIQGVFESEESQT